MPTACRCDASGREADSGTMDIWWILRSGRPCNGRPPGGGAWRIGTPRPVRLLDLGSMAGLLARGSSSVRAFPVSQWHAVARIRRSQLRGQPQLRGVASPAFPFDPIPGNHQRARVMACARARQSSGCLRMRKNVIVRRQLSGSFRFMRAGRASGLTKRGERVPSSRNRLGALRGPRFPRQLPVRTCRSRARSRSNGRGGTRARIAPCGYRGFELNGPHSMTGDIMTDTRGRFLAGQRTLAQRRASDPTGR